LLSLQASFKIDDNHGGIILAHGLKGGGISRGNRGMRRIGIPELPPFPTNCSRFLPLFWEIQVA